MFKKVKEFSGRLKRSFMLGLFEAMRGMGGLSFRKKARIAGNRSHNADTIARLDPRGYLEDQNALSALRYGVKSFDYCGCEIAAVYNALLRLRGKSDPALLPELISRFEQDGAAFSARFGTSPKAALDFFRERRIDVRTAGRPEEFRKLSASCDVLIFTFFNHRKNIFRQIHTVCITREPEGLAVHNSHGRKELYPDFDSLLFGIGDGHGLADGIFMLGIDA